MELQNFFFYLFITFFCSTGKHSKINKATTTPTTKKRNNIASKRFQKKKNPKLYQKHKRNIFVVVLVVHQCFHSTHICLVSSSRVSTKLIKQVMLVLSSSPIMYNIYVDAYNLISSPLPNPPPIHTKLRCCLCGCSNKCCSIYECVLLFTFLFCACLRKILEQISNYLLFLHLQFSIRFY